MVFVVNDLTWFEQKYVAMLHQKYVQCKQHKEPGCHVIFFDHVANSVNLIFCWDPVCISFRVVIMPLQGAHCRSQLAQHLGCGRGDHALQASGNAVL